MAALRLLGDDLSALFLSHLDTDALARLACVAKSWRDLVAAEEHQRIVNSDLGQRWLRRAALEQRRIKWEGCLRNDGSSMPSAAHMFGALEAAVPPYVGGANNSPIMIELPPVVLEASRASWRHFFFGVRDRTVSRNPHGGYLCARSIFEFNLWLRAVRNHSGALFEDGDLIEELDLSPSSYFLHRMCPAHGHVSMKRVLQSNVLISRLIDTSNLLTPSDKSAELEWNLESSGCRDFLEGCGCLEADNYSCSWVVWAVYQGLMNAFVAVSLGHANLDTPVPSRLGSEDSGEWDDVNESTFVPLRLWLHSHRRWISDEVVSLFYEAASEAPPAFDVDDKMSESSDESEIGESEAESEEDGEPGTDN